MKRLLPIAFILLVAVEAFASATVLPNAPGVNFNGFPFSPANGTTRYQQLHINPFDEPTVITEIAFSSWGTGTYFADIEMLLSTTSISGALSATLDDNATLAQKVVYSGSYSTTISSAGHDSFSFRFPFTTPFEYDPAEGNLLLEVNAENMTSTLVREFDGGDSFAAVSRSAATGTIYRAWESEGPGSLAGGTGDIGARILVTATPAAAVPEPSSLAVFGLLFSCFVGCRVLNLATRLKS